jgi:hypothetical protein
MRFVIAIAPRVCAIAAEMQVGACVVTIAHTACVVTRCTAHHAIATDATALRTAVSTRLCAAVQRPDQCGRWRRTVPFGSKHIVMCAR